MQYRPCASPDAEIGETAIRIEISFIHCTYAGLCDPYVLRYPDPLVPPSEDSSALPHLSYIRHRIGQNGQCSKVHYLAENGSILRKIGAFQGLFPTMEYDNFCVSTT